MNHLYFFIVVHVDFLSVKEVLGMLPRLSDHVTLLTTYTHRQIAVVCFRQVPRK